MQSTPQACLVFCLGPYQAAFLLKTVRQVMLRPELQCLPQQPAPLAGFANLQGQWLPVVDLARLLGLPPTPAQNDNQLLQLHDLPWLGLIKSSQDLVQASIGPLPADHALNQSASGLLLHDGQPVVLLDPHRLLLQEETQRLDSLRQQAQVRLQALEPLSPP